MNFPNNYSNFLKKWFSLLFSALLLVILSTLILAHDVEEFSVLISDEAFQPETSTVRQGDTIVFSNVGNNEHWPASDLHPTHTIYPGSNINNCGEGHHMFDSCRGLKPGEQWSFRFTQEGTWKCHDHLFPDLTCTIIVEYDPDFIQEKIEEERLSGKNRIALPIARIFYHFFPNQLDKKLLEMNPFLVTEDEQSLLYWVQLLGSERTMQWILDFSGGGFEIDCHQPAHQVGRISYKLFGAEAFQKGDASCHSGYYHGAMERLLTEEGTDNLAPTINETCSLFKTDFGLFECLHGVGHGVMAFEDYDLPKSLETCDELGDEYHIRSCYGGIFMENIIAAQGLGAVPGHETDWVSDDPHYPCSRIDPDFFVQHECYQMQTSWMLDIYDYNFTNVAAECLNAREDLIPVCFRSYGRDAAGNSLRNSEKMKEHCSIISDEYRDECIAGALHVVVDFWGHHLEGQASEFCRVLEGEDKHTCYTMLVSRLPGIFLEPEPIRAICDTFEEDKQWLCDSYV